LAYKVFFSHSGKDGAWTKYIAERARALGVETYLYEHDPQPGRSIAEKVKQAIAQADALVVLLTQHAQASTYVQQEIGFAEAKSKLIVPLVEPGVSVQELAMLEGREYISFNLQDPGAGLASLLDYLARLKAKKEESQAALAFFGLLIGVAWLSSK
jgi:TIR domain